MARVQVMLKLFLSAVFCFVFTVSVLVVVRTLANYDDEKQDLQLEDEVFYSDSIRLRLVKALNFQTISYAPQNYRKDELDKLIKHIIESFPVLHSSPLVKWQRVNEFSLLYHVKGKNLSLKPFLLTGHMDVVPVDEEHWEKPPFSAEVVNGFIIARGTIDAKDIVMGILEAVEHLLKKGFMPERSFYLGFGHDEEIGGFDGAQHISKLLHFHGVGLEFILDEGTFVLNNSVPGVHLPAAMIGVTEKGSLNLLLTVNAKPGHSSMPPEETSIVILGKAVSKLVGSVFPSMLGKGTEEEFFNSLAKCAAIPFKAVYSNLWLFNSAIAWVMGKKPELSSLIRTSVAVTKISGGSKENVLPSQAKATVNLRVHPAQSTAEAVEFVKYVISDERVDVTVLSAVEPHPVSPFSEASFGYMAVKRSIKQIYPESCVVPLTLVGNTDTRWYLNLTNAIYRFSPVNMNPWELSRFHGHNEMISLSNYVQLINFYINLIRNADSTEIKWKPKHTHEL